MEQSEPHSDARGLVGQVVDKRYRVTDIIGIGGMANVYRAEHVTIRRAVAIKVLHPSISQLEQLTARFEREAFAAGRIEHPNCVTALDFGELADGSHYMVMELLEGESLGDILERDAPLDVERALHITRHVLHGLRAAHTAGVVHRDIKPDNVFVEVRDNDPAFARLIDFGIAKLLGEAVEEEGGDKLTQAGIAFGTPIYMSPEQAYGQPAGPQSDLYSLSVLLYEMLTGRPPFESDDKMAVLQMHASQPPPPFAEVAPDRDIPPEVEALVRKGLAKSPEDRFESADAYLTALIEMTHQWDQVWAERTPTAMRQPLLTPMPGVGVSSAPDMTLPPQSGVAGWSRLEKGLAAAVVGLAFLFILLVAVGTKDPPDPYEVAVKQLATAPTCAERKQAVAKLLELGDKRAIPALRAARDRKAKKKDSPASNRCLRKEAIKAIIVLKQKKP